MVKHHPYQAQLLGPPHNFWWPVAANESLVIGDQIPGDEATARLMARCCNVAYRHAVHDVLAALKEAGIDAAPLLLRALGPLT